jgi:hypothetical protein
MSIPRLSDGSSGAKSPAVYFMNLIGVAIMGLTSNDDK